MTLQECLCRHPQRLAIEWPIQAKHYLDRVEIRSLGVVKSMEQ